MNTAENKLSLLQLIIESDDKAFLSKLLSYAQSLRKHDVPVSDEEIEIPDSVLEEVRLAMEELESGKDAGVSHEDMMVRFRKDFPGLKL